MEISVFLIGVALIIIGLVLIVFRHKLRKFVTWVTEELEVDIESGFDLHKTDPKGDNSFLWFGALGIFLGILMIIASIAF